MAAQSSSSSECCTLKKALNKLISKTSASPRARTHSEPLYVISLERYGRDPDFEIRFPDVISMSECLFDASITDGDRKIRVSMDPSLNRLISKNKLHCGSVIRNVEFSRGEDNDEDGSSFHVCNLEVDRLCGGDAALRALSSVNVRSIPWLGETPNSGPLRARRSSYLPLWNNQDFYGDVWRDTPPSESGAEDDSEDEREDTRSTVSLSVIRRRFLSGSRRFPGVLCVRILHKSRLIYYGKTDQKCECPYKAELIVGDGSSNACVVLWNTLCLDWFRILQPGQVVKLSCYRVKESYSSRSGQESEPQIEISLNSRNPPAQISIIPKNQISPDWLLPDLPHTFICRQELPSCPHGQICDVIGVVIFIGRSERVRSQDGQRSELEEYRWLQLEDRTSDRPIVIKLFSTSQPDIQSRIYPLALLVCTRLKLIRSAIDRTTSFEYLTNTSLTQVYCTGTGSHPVMPYKGVRPVRQFLQWLKQVDEGSMLERAVIGGYFSYPPLPVSLHSFMEKRQGGAGLISGGEMKLECERMNYRERRRFAIQCVITAACYHHREDSGRTLYTDLPSAPLSPRLPRQRGSEPHRTTVKRKLFSSGPTTHGKRFASPLPPVHPPGIEEDTERDFSLFDGAMEFLVGECDNDSSDEDDDGDFSTLPTSPLTSRLGVLRVAIETLPRVFCYERRHIQAAAVGMQHNSFHKLLPQRELESFSPASCYTGNFTLTMRALSDGVTLDVIFLPAVPGTLHWTPLPLSHNNSWESVLSHGGFSPHVPPPSPDFSLFDGAMEFLVGECDNDSSDEDDDGDFSTLPTSPLTSRLGVLRVAIETLPRVFCYERRHIQAAAVGMQHNSFHKLLPQRELESFSPASCYTGNFTLTMRALSDGVTLDVIFLPAVPGTLHWTPLPLSHNNSWESVLSHGGFSPHVPPPSPADLITKADQLTNQRLLCVLEACALGGEKVELVLNRAFPFR
ncbi:RPA-related protein RADX isoform X2 [Triplophysa dalaica]|uniref:RPA-related protein RADX isoform X2 n=1 Tax=Triplophysa dalaica TaxID=1582913 RepID=UPI0024E0182D|nr:RPA-related protein RADX isoform X2 [Triplophysa dalaica]